MAIAAGAIFEVRSTGSDTNGGGFVPGTAGTTDYSQQDTPVLALTDGVANGTTTITSTTGGFTAAMNQNLAYIGGSIYQITAVGSSTSITVDRTVATASALAINVGGALATIGMVGSAVTNVGGPTVYITGSTAISVATANVSGGYVTNVGWNIIGYGATRGDGVRATITASVSGITMITYGNVYTQGAKNLTLDGGGLTRNNGIQFGSSWQTAENLYVQNLKGTGINGSGMSMLCYAYNCGIGFYNIGCYYCVASACATGFQSLNGAENCIAANCTAYGFDVSGTYDKNPWKNCSAFNCVYGLAVSNAVPVVINCAFYGNSTADISDGSGSGMVGRFINNAFATILNADSVYSGSLTLTANPWANPTASITDIPSAFAAFALNNTAGGGALCRGAGTPQYLDIGAVQHQDSGGGALFLPPVTRRIS